MRDATGVLNRYRDQIVGLRPGSDLRALKEQILGDLWREQITVTPALRSLLDRTDFYTPLGFESAMRSLSRGSSTERSGRATTSYLATMIGAKPAPSAGAVTPSDAVCARRPARNDEQAQLQVDTLLRDLIANVHADTNEELLQTLAERAAKAARQLSCDIVNECGGPFRGSLDGIEQRYTNAFRRSLQRIGIDFQGGYWAGAKIGKAGCDRLEIELRLNAELSAAFSAEEKPIGGAPPDEVIRWFMKRKPEATELAALAFQGAPATPAEQVREAFLSALVTNAVPRRDSGEEISSHVGQFAEQFRPRDLRGEPDALATKIMEVAYRRLGLQPMFERQRPFAPGKSGSVERGRLAFAVGRDPELSARFEEETGKAAARAGTDELFSWFQTSKPRLDQVLRIATADLPNDERGLTRERIIELFVSQAQQSRSMELALIVIKNTLDAQRPGELFEEALRNVSIRLRERVSEHPELRARIAKEQPKDVLDWFQRQPADAATLIALAGV